MKRCLVALACLSGCSWGLGEMRGLDACQREVLALDTLVQLASIEASLPPEIAEPIAPMLDTAKTNCADQVERARIAQADHGYTPKEFPPIRGEEDDVSVQAYAGMAKARAIRRKIRQELPSALVKGIGNIVADAIPKWAWYAGAAYLFISLGGLAFAIKLWRGTKSGLRDMIRRANDPSVKEHFKGATNGVVQKEYRHMSEAGLLQ